MTEPTTTITDYILAAETVFLGILLWRHHPFWALAFFALAIAAAAGGTYHGFIGALSASGARTIWKITLYSIGIATLLMLASTFRAYIHPPWKQILIAIAVAQFLFYVFVVTRNDDFRFVIYNYVPAMVAILVLAVIHKNLWLVGAVLISFAGAVIQQSGIEIHRHFNFNDIYHVVQMVGMYFFYRGGRLLQAG